MLTGNAVGQEVAHRLQGAVSEAGDGGWDSGDRALGCFFGTGIKCTRISNDNDSRVAAVCLLSWCLGAEDRLRARYTKSARIVDGYDELADGYAPWLRMSSPVFQTELSM